ncbi:MAG: BlaI/MecI/CopY family transcriptional regulator [Alphaproteobacteria bacterium]|nr:BlaI/MecI/CopY family transcriptional regulator [Alphaproteobacteria bacterium]
MIKNLVQYFTDLGLKEEDAKIYLACLNKPNGLFVHELVKQTNIKRSTIDLILNRLAKNGFVSRHKEGARWVYCAEPPERIAFTFKEKLQNFEDILPVLLTQMTSEQLPVVRFFEGKSGLEQIYDDILLTCGMNDIHQNELLIISSGQDLVKILPSHGRNFIRKRVKRGIKAKILAPDNNITRQLYKNGTELLRNTLFFDNRKYPFNVEINIYGNKIALLNLQSANINGTIIQNEAIASSMRSIFMMLWLFHQKTV